ncbi:MAG: 2-amino-4-hydroxy-6-hydroxymethyldihydropteridine diphosphokinase [Bacteroidales bacterium]|jgi:2-amino-4-hydroxy-6-hydroxymethyldihydropteridine diphosphokinase|nr:2-amino-4-hydroxy-6-hydroxymethyldihydropteridine diphosphokinase [Bacteroidales bacterium]
MEDIVFLGLGSNIEPRTLYLSRAIENIGQWGNITAQSFIMETKAEGFAGFPFLNQVIAMHTYLCPFFLLYVLENIEQKWGREKKSLHLDKHHEYHNRTIDIDILLYGKLKVQTSKLTIPHPRMEEREFVMKPLLFLFPLVGFFDPIHG